MKKMIKDNKGIALITVVIGVMFCLLLTSTMLRVSLLGLQSRNINNQVSDSFYDAESVVDTMRVNVQNIAVTAWSGTADTTNTESFVQNTYKLLTGSSSYSEAALTDTQKANVINNLQKYNATTGSGNLIEGGEIITFSGLEHVKVDGVLEALTIKDIEVRYTDPKTQVTSLVKTDITIRAPKYASDVNPPLGSYSMFAGCGAKLYAQHGGSNAANGNEMAYFEQQGNVYIGYDPDNKHSDKDADAIEIGCNETFILSGNNVVINGNVLITNHSNLQITGQKVEIRGTICLGPNCHLIIGTKTQLVCKDIRFYTSDGNITNYTNRETKANYTSVSGDGGYHQMNGGAKYEKGVPYKHYDPTHNKSNNPYYSKAASIIYVKTEYENTSSAAAKKKSRMIVQEGAVYDVGISNTGVITYSSDAGLVDSDFEDPYGQQITPITVNRNDAKLNIKPRTNVDPYKKNPDGTPVKYTHEYDDYFMKIIDVEYFEKFMYELKPSSMNWCKNKLKSNSTDADGKEIESNYYFKKSVDNPEAKYIAKYPGSSSSFENCDNTEVFYGVTVSGTTNPTFSTVFISALVDNIMHSGDFKFYLASLSLDFHVDNATSSLDAVCFTSEKLTLKKDQGYCLSRSFLDMDTTTNHQYLKPFLTEIGKRVATADLTQQSNGTNNNDSNNIKYLTYNNLFRGGMKSFWEEESSTSGDPGKSINVQYNSALDFIDTSNYDKHFDPTEP